MRVATLLNRILVVLALLTTLNLFADDKGQPDVRQTKTLNVRVKGTQDASFTLFQFSFFAPLQIFPERDDVYGMRLSLPYGSNATLSGLDLGVVNRLDSLYGVGISLIYSRRNSDMRGLNFAGAFNLSTGNDVGLSIAGVYNNVNAIDGVQTALLLNKAKRVHGLQLGLFNYCEKMDGAQMGLFNYCEDQPFKCTFFFNFWDSSTVAKQKMNR